MDTAGAVKQFFSMTIKYNFILLLLWACHNYYIIDWLQLFEMKRAILIKIFQGLMQINILYVFKLRLSLL